MQEPFPQPQPLTTIKTKPGPFPCFKAFQTCSPERDLNYISNKNFITSWCVCVCDITSLDIQTKFGVGWGNPTARAGQMGFIPGSGRSPEEKRGNPFQYSCPENPMDREAWQATVHEVPVSPTPTQGSILSLQGGYNKPPYQSATLGPAFPHDSSKQNRKVPSLHRHMLSIWPQFPSLQLPRWC